jgi:hypothetical protein
MQVVLFSRGGIIPLSYSQQSRKSFKGKGYYLIRSFVDYEKKDTVVEKTCLALVWTTKKLRNY